mmetsp:Transcript_23496/g.44809  ORF Transcript_23496/g.44809 Transcript_23496/m.44809 type:complete len:316 (+) Transcript_23496:357-1304(+)
MPTGPSCFHLRAQLAGRRAAQAGGGAPPHGPPPPPPRRRAVPHAGPPAPRPQPQGQPSAPAAAPAPHLPAARVEPGHPAPRDELLQPRHGALRAQLPARRRAAAEPQVAGVWQDGQRAVRAGLPLPDVPRAGDGVRAQLLRGELLVHLMATLQTPRASTPTAAAHRGQRKRLLHASSLLSVGQCSSGAVDAAVNTGIPVSESRWSAPEVSRATSDFGKERMRLECARGGEGGWRKKEFAAVGQQRCESADHLGGWGGRRARFGRTPTTATNENCNGVATVHCAVNYAQYAGEGIMDELVGLHLTMAWLSESARGR